MFDIVINCKSFKELAIKIGYKSPKGDTNKTIKKRLIKHNISTDHFTSTTPTKRNKENIFIKNSTASQKVLRNWYKKCEFSKYECSIYGQIPFWNGKELVLTLDHINGVNNDDRIENLRWVCPNCDRQLATYAGRNITKIKFK